MSCARVDPHGAHGHCPGLRPMPNDIRDDGLAMVLRFNDTDPLATCECGHRSFGDSINDAVIAWAEHVTRTPACRERL